MTQGNRLFVKITRDSLPQVKDKYPFIYLERGRLEIDDSSLKWIDCEANVVRLPIATINTILLGPGTTVTHDAVKTAVAANCSICWVGEDCLLFYAAGLVPTSDSRNFRRQMELACDSVKSLEVARRFFERRFPTAALADKSLKEMMGMEGYRVRELYAEKAEQYKVGWGGRNFTQGKFEVSDITNQVLTATNAALYGILCAAIHSLGYSPHIGFIHSGSPLPFIYDMADLYKEALCIDLAFKVTRELAGVYNKALVAAEFRGRVVSMNLLAQIALDVTAMLDGGGKDAHRCRK